MYWSRIRTEREINRPTPLKMTTDARPSKLAAVFTDDLSKYLAIVVFISSSIRANSIA